MPTRDSRESVAYPVTIDTFEEVTRGRRLGGKISAYRVNKLYNALRAVETHTRYAGNSSLSSTGTTIVLLTSTQTTREVGKPSTTFMVAVPQDVAQRYFGGSPFNRQFGLIATATLVRQSSSGPEYHLMEAAASPPSENNNLNCRVVVLKSNGDLKRGDSVVLNLMLIIPG